MIFIKAYQAYQNGNYDYCLKILQEVKQNDVARMSLQAQVYFRKKDYQKSYDIYTDLLKKDDKHADAYRDNIKTLIVCSKLENIGTLKTSSNDKIPAISEIIEQVESMDLIHKNELPISHGVESKKKSTRQKKRRKRLPKQYDPVAGPDPERWLPRRDRKGNLHKQKKRRQRPVTKGKPRPK